ncbi:ABC transporter substrate-binding protein [Bradyrhizobium sp. AUGA SZCCT0431]|uniref:ABC transporter substrate-binding protein n=1 Tax=Bradyrhizobium sp. AUGA SZCCT0431 TaxID=2807674 RepID=UPI001BAC629F|nr:ABC transporter substrate-binding protein [Bradyrhizobium sp. AUGA SZCCT0431]MBR1142875.1 ABC transporter substrate-binding protein [Bradyrhizobium sp. AUGA SZCCT0431]
MKRREFIVGLLGTSLWSSAVNSQPRVPTVGILLAGNRDPAPLLAVFKDEMQRLGYLEGQNIRIDLRSAQGRAEALPRLASELVERKVDVILAWLTPAVRAAKQATTQIPIVMAGAGDPVATGLVASLVRPGGNITGMGGITDLIGKNVELIRELLPSARKLAALCNATDSYTKPFLEQIEVASSKTGFELLTVMIPGPDDLESSFSRVSRDGVDVVLVQPSLPVRRAAELAVAARLPAVSPLEGFVSDGGLLSYAGRSSDQFRRATQYVDKILKGARPADLPIQLPTQFDLKINLRTAKAIGLAIPPGMLARADEVLE